MSGNFGLIIMPTVVVYIPNNLYEELVLEARELNVSVTKLIVAIVRVYYEQKRKAQIPHSARELPR